MGVIKIENGSVSPMEEFRCLMQGEIFRHEGILHIKICSIESRFNAFNLEQCCSCSFGGDTWVLPMNGKLIVENRQ